MTTIHDRLVAALEAQGFAIDNHTRTTKYTVLSKGRGAYYVGRAGALRTGASASSSIPVSEKLKADLLAGVYPARAKS